MMRFSLASNHPVSGQASIVIDADDKQTFAFVAENFFSNYPKWATDVTELESLDGGKVCVGAKGRQVRKDNDTLTESIFEIVNFKPHSQFALKGLDAPYLQTYSIENQVPDEKVELTFKFDLLEIEIFMRPFEKLIRAAIDDGAETAVENIRNLLIDRVTCKPGA